jgi:hypothetical protein
MKRTCVLLSIFITVFLLSFSPSDTPLDRLIAGFKKYLDELPQEKVYLHFDRPYYTSGETIWVKAYLTAGAFHLPSTLSRTIYIELISGQGEVVRQVKLLSINGSATGDFVLPDSLESGRYLVRGYTNWMKNAGEDYFFHRLVRIWNGYDQSPAKTSAEKNIDVQFFPEGGDLVNGISSKVAFKAVASDGLGRQIKGKVVDESDVLLCEFRSNVLGMGAFTLTPVKGKSYRAIIENYQLQVELPPTKESGLAMSIKNSPNSANLLLRIETRDRADLKTIYILAQTRGIVCYAARMDMSANIMMANIPKSKFPSGIAQITVTNQDGTPLAERLAFVNELEQMSIEVIPDKTSYFPRELVTLRIQATHANGTPAVADLSLAVCDDSQVLPDENRETIGTYLMLSSELKGQIESPGYYFNPMNKDRAEALDHLLLTQGWRRFTFKKALNPQWQNPEYKIEKGLTIKGTLLDASSNKPITDGKVTYLSVDPPPFTSVVRTNSMGDFEFNDLIYFDSAKTVLQGETKKGSKLTKIVVDTTSNFHAVHFPRLPMQVTQTEFERTFVAGNIERKNIDKTYNFDEKTVLLKEVEIRGIKEDPQAQTGRTYGRGSLSVQVAGVRGRENQLHPLQLLQGVAGVQITGGGQNLSVSIRNGGTPFIMIDDVPVPMESLSTISVQDIERIEIWKGADAAVFGLRGSNGALGFYTKKGAGSIARDGILTMTNMGFQIEKEFYTPNYDTEKPEHIKPDKRTTLFWAPLIQTDSAGRASVSFYNHDVETTVTTVVEGISRSGKSGATTVRYAIRKN